MEDNWKMKFFRNYLGGIALAIFIAMIMAFIIPNLSGGAVMVAIAIFLLPFLYGISKK